MKYNHEQWRVAAQRLAEQLVSLRATMTNDMRLRYPGEYRSHECAAEKLKARIILALEKSNDEKR